MIKDERREERYRLLCEKEVNESWSKVERYTEEIVKILDKKKITDDDLTLLKIVARVFVQKAMLDKAESIALFGVDLYDVSPCGMNLKKNCPCSRDKCLLLVAEED